MSEASELIGDSVHISHAVAAHTNNLTPRGARTDASCFCNRHAYTASFFKPFIENVTKQVVFHPFE